MRLLRPRRAASDNPSRPAPILDDLCEAWWGAVPTEPIQAEECEAVRGTVQINAVDGINAVDWIPITSRNVGCCTCVRRGGGQRWPVCPAQTRGGAGCPVQGYLVHKKTPSPLRPP